LLPVRRFQLVDQLNLSQARWLLHRERAAIDKAAVSAGPAVAVTKLCVNGDHFPELRLEIRKVGPGEFEFHFGSDVGLPGADLDADLRNLLEEPRTQAESRVELIVF